MIRINLLPVKAAKKREYGRQQLTLFALILVLAAIGNYIWYGKVDAELSGLNASIARTNTEIAQLDKTIGEVKSIKEEKRKLEDKLKILDTLKRNRTGPVKILDELASIIPNKVWVTAYDENNGGVTLGGAATTYEDFSSFAKKLKESKHFRDVTIKSAKQRTDTVVEWTITCTADYSV